MISFQQSIKYFRVKIALAFSTLVFMITVLIISYFYIKHKDVNVFREFNFNTIAFIVLAILTVLGLVFFLTRRLTNDLKTLNSEIKNDVKTLELNLEKAKTSSENKTVYLSNMSHEIRNPLNAVIGMLNMLKQTNLDSDQKVQLEMAEYSSEHLLQLVNMILDNSKVGTESTELNIVVIDLKPDLLKLSKVFEYQAWEKGLEFEFKFSSTEKDKYLLLGDLTRIQQVLINLINNAIKFTNSGKITITIDQAINHDEYQIVTFYVKDTGAGMPPDEADWVFNAFEQDGSFSAKHSRGLGIGLSISSQLVRLMGGELKLESKENEGSIFYFSLQLKKTMSLKTEESEPLAILLNKFDFKFSVLVAEDDRMNQKVIKFLLEQQGADCTFAKNGLEAVKLYNVLDFDMVFMDIFMPEMSGYEATKIIKASEKYEAHNIPIIAVSASAFEEDIANAKLAGIDDFLAKPIEVAKLKELLVKYSPKEGID